MLLSAGTIWDIKIQCVCGIISAREGDEVEIFMCGNFGQASLSPPRVIINPNRLYPIEPIIRRQRRFAINVLAASQRDVTIRLTQLRRRATGKADLLGVLIRNDDQHNIPFVPDCLRTVFCSVEEVLSTGDHTVMIASVLESRPGPRSGRELPLLYTEVSGTQSRHPRFHRAMRRALVKTGVKEELLKMLRRRNAASVDLAANTYQEGGQTEAEVEEIVRHGLQDRGRAVSPRQQSSAVLKGKLGVCVVGVGAWGSYHCQLFREASPQVELYVCGRDPDRVARVARGVGAKDFIIGLENALQDQRVQAVSLALPHDIHRRAVEMAAAAGKHVLVEKPIATTLDDADAMIGVVRHSGIVFMVAEDMHFRPGVREALRVIDRGDIGEPLYLLAHGGGVMRPRGWKADRQRMGGGVLMDVGVHYVRALRLLMGEPDRVLASRAMQVDTKMSGEDSVQVLLSSRYGWEAHMLLNWSSPRGHAPDLIVAGEKGTLHLWPGDPYLDYYPTALRPCTLYLGYVRPRWLAERLMSPTLQRVRRPVPGHREGAYLAEVREFLAAVARGAASVTDPGDARRDLEIVLRGYEALAQGVWVGIEPYRSSG
jgi:predicted dehydrogenase/flavin reductase (DIM6/NTAB) family NADH-FMN oxidoreductase RutF